MSDPVREALRAATAEAEDWMRDAAGRRRVCPADAMERMTAAAVAAFLRARARRAAVDGVSTIPIEWMHEAAGAVERASREAGE